MTRVVSAVLVLFAVLLGCSSGGVATTGADATPASASSAPAGPIPPVHNPKNLAAILPCLLFTPTQLEANGLDQHGRPKDVLGSAGCEWGDRARTRQVRIFVDLGSDVLRNVYAKRETFPLMEVTRVTGYPAIRTMDDVKGTTCYFRVSTAERQTLVLGFTSLQGGPEDPCAPAKALAETVISNLPPLQA